MHNTLSKCGLKAVQVTWLPNLLRILPQLYPRSPFANLIYSHLRQTYTYSVILLSSRSLSLCCQATTEHNCIILLKFIFPRRPAHHGGRDQSPQREDSLQPSLRLSLLYTYVKVATRSPLAAQCFFCCHSSLVVNLSNLVEC